VHGGVTPSPITSADYEQEKTALVKLVSTLADSPNTIFLTSFRKLASAPRRPEQEFNRKRRRRKCSGYRNRRARAPGKTMDRA